MFARQVDPFQAYNSARSAAEKHHKDLLEQENLQRDQELKQRLGQDQPPHIDSSSRRKRSFVFEPDFLSAFDSAQQDSTSSSAGSKSRPYKKARCTASLSIPILSSLSACTEPPHVVKGSSHPATTSSSHPKRVPTTTTAHGPSIIDLSSGEELVSLHVGTEHKRRRESVAGCPEDGDSLREVFDVQEDGTLLETKEHAPALPSPTKRAKLEKTRPHLQFLDPSEDDLNQARKAKKSNKMDTIKNKNKYRNRLRDRSSAELDSWMSEDDDEERKLPIFKEETQALVRYQGPRTTMSLAKGLDALIRHRQIEQANESNFSLEDAHGHELVLYRGGGHQDNGVPRVILAGPSLFEESSSTVIEELEDNEGEEQLKSFAGSEGSKNLMDELQDKIMDMDLD
jgi:hypothetical protein